MGQPNGGGALTFIKDLLDIHPFVQQPTVVDTGLSNDEVVTKNNCAVQKGAPTEGSLRHV